MKKGISETTANVIAAGLVVVFIGALVALYLVAHVTCHRYIGPFMTGSTDPVAVALYCKPRL
jgi:hypothetical protein